MAIMALLANMDDEDRIDLYELSEDLNWGSRKIPVMPLAIVVNKHHIILQ